MESKHKIEREHAEYASRLSMWRKYRDLYAGGEQLRASAPLYLVPRNKEPVQVYAERLERVFYENYVGSIIDWYAATLMRREPSVALEGNNESGQRFFNELLYDCDRRGTNFTTFFRERLISALVLGKSYMTVEFPKSERAPLSRAEEDAMGRSRAYLVSWDADDVTNWSEADDGTLDWIVIRNQCHKQRKLSDEASVGITKWVYYDRQNFEIYEQVDEGTGKCEIRLIDQGRHGLAAQNRVPVFELRISEGLWLMNKSALLQLEHFNKSNALGWALTMRAVRDAGHLLGQRIQATGWGILLHPTREGRPIRVDGAGGEGIPNCDREPGTA